MYYEVVELSTFLDENPVFRYYLPDRKTGEILHRRLEGKPPRGVVRRFAIVLNWSNEKLNAVITSYSTPEPVCPFKAFSRNWTQAGPHALAAYLARSYLRLIKHVEQPCPTKKSQVSSRSALRYRSRHGEIGSVVSYHRSRAILLSTGLPVMV